MVTYIGLDQSLTHTGFAIYYPHDNMIHTSTILNKKTKLPLYQRHAILTTSLLHICNKVKPEKVFLEGVHYQNNRGKAHSVLYAVKSLIEYELYKNGYEFEDISVKSKDNSSWPKILGLKTAKHCMNEWLGDLVKGLSDHETDAIGVLWGSLVRYNKVEANDLLSITIQNADHILQSP